MQPLQNERYTKYLKGKKIHIFRIFHMNIENRT